MAYEECGLHALVFIYIFLLTVRRIRMFLSLKSSAPPEETSLSVGLTVSEELGNKHTNKQIDRLTDILLV